MVILVPAAILALVAMRGSARRLVRKHGGGALLWRFASGRHLDGADRTDAGFLRPGVTVLHPSGHASRWAHLPRAHRAGARLGSVTVAGLIGVGMMAARTATIVAVSAGAVLALAVAALVMARTVREWNHARVYVRPLHRALAPFVGVPLATRPQAWLTVPRGFAEAESAEIRISLPEGFLTTADAKRAIALAVTDKLALEDAALSFRTVGRKAAAIITTTAPPPRAAGFAQLREVIDHAPASAPVIGTGRNGKPVSADFEADSPHVLVSAGSGGGKSTIVRGLVAQGLHNGAVAVVCDIKRISHAWTRGMPNVIYARDIAEIHNTLISVKTELDRRNGLVDELADENGDLPPEAKSQMGPRILLVMEEMNATARRLADYWRKVKTKEDPAVSPAVEALGDILFMGRAVLVNVIAVAQMMTAKTLGGPEARENFATRIMARYTVNAWKMLAPEVWPMPRSSRHAGRLQVVIGGSARETQGVYFTSAEARSWGLCGAVSAIALPDAEAAADTPRPSVPGATDQGNGAGTVPAAPEPVTLREACSAGLLSVSLDVARAARKRDPDFPRTAGIKDGAMTYDPASLARWEANRPMALKASG